MAFPTLRPGSRGPAVRALQLSLRAVGRYQGPLSSRYDAATARGVSSFERSRHLAADGIADGRTRKALAAAAGSQGQVVARKGSTGSAVRALQAGLRALGFFKHSVTGYFGDITHRALKAFEARFGLQADGRFDRLGRRLLRTVLGQRAEAQGSASGAASVTLRGSVGKLTWSQAAALVRKAGGAVNPGGRPTILAVRTADRATRRYQDWFVVLKPGGRLAKFAATTRPTVSGAAMLKTGVYSLAPRWRDGKFNNDAFLVERTNGSLTVGVSRDTNRDGVFSKAELRRRSFSDLIRLHRGYSTSTSSTGCLNIKDYGAFLRYVGGRNARMNLALING